MLAAAAAEARAAAAAGAAARRRADLRRRHAETRSAGGEVDDGPDVGDFAGTLLFRLSGCGERRAAVVKGASGVRPGNVRCVCVCVCALFFHGVHRSELRRR